MLKKYSKQLQRVAEALLEYETLDGDQIRDLCKGLNISIKKSNNKDDKPKAKKPIEGLLKCREFGHHRVCLPN